MTETAFRESTKPLLRPHQAEEMTEEKRRLEGMLSAPPHIASAIQDRGQIVRQLATISRNIKAQLPQAYTPLQLDEAHAREAELMAEIQAGMPTQEEMRRNPPGAVDKHRAWERRNKANILEWKNIRLRMQASGMLDGDARGVANVEALRPRGLSQSLDMAGAQIPGRDFYLPPAGAGPAVVMSDKDAAILNEIDPGLHSRMAILSNEHRAEVLALVHRYAELPDSAPDGAPEGTTETETSVGVPMTPTRKPRKDKGKAKRQWTPERRRDFAAKMKASREAKKKAG